MKRYRIAYVESSLAEEDKIIEVKANNSAEAYDKALLKLEVIRGIIPYSAYVDCYITKDYKVHTFTQNLHGKAY